MRKFTALFIFSICFLAFAGSAEAYERLFYYREGKEARASFFAHPKSIDIFSPQFYGIQFDGTMSGTFDPVLLAFAKKHKIKIMPLITNSNFSRKTAHAVLDDPQKQEKVITALILEAKNHGFWGWQFDFEQIDADYRDKYSAFVRKASEELKKNNLKTSVAVIAQISENPDDYKPNLWQKIIGVYDYAALASSTDFVSIMSYDDPDSTGPVARYTWVKKVLEHSISKIPEEKLSLGLSLYYWKWNETTGKRVGIGSWPGIKRAIGAYKVVFGYDKPEEARFFKYTLAGITYSVWYENAASLQKKLDLIHNMELRGFSAWALGQEVPDIHRIISKK